MPKSKPKPPEKRQEAAKPAKTASSEDEIEIGGVEIQMDESKDSALAQGAGELKAEAEPEAREMVMASASVTLWCPDCGLAIHPENRPSPRYHHAHQNGQQRGGGKDWKCPHQGKYFEAPKLPLFTIEKKGGR